MDNVAELSLDECVDRLRDRITLHYEAGELLFSKLDKSFVGSHLLLAALVNRSIALVRGFCDLVPSNYIAAAPLVRLQLDNVLRFSALWLVDDRDEFTKQVLEGNEIRKLKDRDNLQMHDGYLVEKLESQIPGLKQAYKDACGYVHFSESHLYHTIASVDERIIQLEIGQDLGVTKSIRKEAVLLMDQMTRLLLDQMKCYLQEHQLM